MSAAENELETFKSADNTTGLQPNPDEAVRTAGSKRKPITRKTHLFVTICHWSMVILIALNLASGMRLGWGHIESRLGGGSNGTWSAILGAIAPKGALLGVNLITLHVTLAFFMFAVIGVYIVYLFWSRASHRMRLTSHDLRKLRTGMKAKNFWRNKAALWSANLLVYWVSFLFLSVLIVTGAMLYWLEWSPLDWAPFRLLGGYPSVRLLHGIVAYLFVPYIILHSVLQWFFGNFWSIFKAQLYRPHIRAGVIGLVIGLPVAGGLFAWNENLTTLTATRIHGDLQAPVLDGDSSDPVWSRAKAVTIRTVKGVNNPEGHVDVLVKAAHDGYQIYFLFQWKDPDVSYKRFPLRKTLDGWEVLNTAYERWDENVYYEDKLAMYITDDQSVAIGQAFDALGIPVSEVITSPYCRCVETAKLAFGRARVSNDLAFSIGTKEQEAKRLAQALRNMLGTRPTARTNTVLVAHTANLKEAAQIWPKPEGVAFIFKPLGNNTFEMVSRIEPQQWPELAEKMGVPIAPNQQMSPLPDRALLCGRQDASIH